MGSHFWEYWYFHIPNYILAALVYTLLGRFAMSFFLPPDSPNYIWRFFRRLTDPVLRTVAVITPRFINGLVLPPIAAYWLFQLRYLWLWLLAAYGLAPQIAAG